MFKRMRTGLAGGNGVRKGPGPRDAEDRCGGPGERRRVRRHHQELGRLRVFERQNHSQRCVTTLLSLLRFYFMGSVTGDVGAIGPWISQIFSKGIKADKFISDDISSPLSFSCKPFDPQAFFLSRAGRASC